MRNVTGSFFGFFLLRVGQKMASFYSIITENAFLLDHLRECLFILEQSVIQNSSGSKQMLFWGWVFGRFPWLKADSELIY
jgi:hypothetical protein